MFPECRILAMPSSGRLPAEMPENVDIMMSDISGVINASPEWAVIASPSSYHVEHAIPLIRAQIPTLIEKPLSHQLSTAQSLFDLNECQKTPVAVAFCLRYLASTLVVKELIRDSVVGELIHVSSNVGQYLPDWRAGKNYKKSVSASKKLGGGVLLELSHELDYLQWLFGTLHLEYSNLSSSKWLDLDVEDIADLVLRTDSGVICSIHMDFIQKVPQRKCSIIGSEGRIDWDLIGDSVKVYRKNCSEIAYHDPNYDKNNMYLRMMEDFISYTKGHRNNCVYLTEACKSLKIIEKAKLENVRKEC